MRTGAAVALHLLLVLAAAAQADPRKVGLVLGGGGARGSAHIGVLKVLEENRIPVHVVSGTSMGALVGGAYAAGLSPEDLQRIIGGIDWKRVMADDPVRRDLAIRDKIDRRKYLGLEFGVKKGGIVLPQGAMQGQKLEHILRTMTLHVADIDDFSRLPIPFTAVAVDLESGKEVDLSRGSLVDALRASMAVPGAFSPVAVDGRLLADGYVVKNVPVDVAQRMGADVLIVVDVGSPLYKREDLGSFLSVSGQAGTIMMRRNVEEQIGKMGPGDVLIRPDLGDISSASFDRVAEGVEAGERAARAAIEKLRRFSVSAPDYAAFLKNQRKARAEPPTVGFVRVEGTSRVPAETILARIRTEAGRPLDLERVRSDITRIHSLGDFEKVGFRLDEEDGRTGIVFVTREKSWGPDYLRVGLNLATNFNGDSVYNLMANYAATELNDLGAEWELEGQFGRTDRLATELTQPLERSRTLFMAPSAEWRQESSDIYVDHERVAEYRVRRLELGGDVGLSLGTLAEIRAGIYGGAAEAAPSTGSAGLPDFDVDRAGLRIQATFDQIDDHYFPKNGLYARSDAWFERESLGADASYEKIWNVAHAVATFGRHTFLVGATYGVSPDDDVPFYDEFTLGGFLSLSGLRHQELRGTQAASLRLVYYVEVLNLLTSLVQEAYVGGSFEGGNTWRDFDDVSVGDFELGGSVFLGVRTLLGPLYLAVGKNEDGRRAEIYLYLGQVF